MREKAVRSGQISQEVTGSKWCSFKPDKGIRYTWIITSVLFRWLKGLVCSWLLNGIIQTHAFWVFIYLVPLLGYVEYAQGLNLLAPWMRWKTRTIMTSWISAGLWARCYACSNKSASPPPGHVHTLQCATTHHPCPREKFFYKHKRKGKTHIWQLMGEGAELVL